MEVYCEAMQSDWYSKYDLAPGHLPAHPLQYWQVIGSSQLGLGDCVNFTITIIGNKTSQFPILEKYFSIINNLKYIYYTSIAYYMSLLFEFWFVICPKIECFLLQTVTKCLFSWKLCK